MGREVPFKVQDVCDDCGATGAYDFMGDYLCQDCADKAMAVEMMLDGDETDFLEQKE